MLEKSTVRILVLDDESFMLKLLNRMLSNLGFINITLCDNGRAALERIAETGPNLILLDLNMPEMDGIEFVRHLVERHYAGSLILISGEDERMLQTANDNPFAPFTSRLDWEMACWAKKTKTGDNTLTSLLDIPEV